MSKWHHRSVWWSWLASVLAVVGLGLGLTTVPASASPAPMPPRDPAAMVGQVGPQIVNINTKFGYNNAIGAGTGIVIDPGGVVLTNNHVIAGATDISAFSIGNGQTYAADVIGYDRNPGCRGAAACAVPVACPPPRSAGVLRSASRSSRWATPAAQGGTPSAMAGHVVALNQAVSATDTLTGAAENLGGLIQADTAIRPGDSGGPLVNSGRAGGRHEHRRHGQLQDVGRPGLRHSDRYGVGGGRRHPGRCRRGHSPRRPDGLHRVWALRTTTATARGSNAWSVAVPLPRPGIAAGDVIFSLDGVPINGPTAMTDVLVPHHPGDNVTCPGIPLRAATAP